MWLRSAKNASAPASVRQQPAIFCCSFTMRRLRPAWLLSNGMRVSSSHVAGGPAGPWTLWG